MGKRDNVMDLVKALSGQARVLVIPRFYIELCKGDHLAALLLNQILYWSDRTTDPDGWFSKSYPEWQDELALTAYQVKRAIHGDNRSKKEIFCLTEIGVETDLRQSSHHQGAATLHYRVNEDTLQQAINDHLNHEPNIVDPPQQCLDTPPNNVKGAPSTMFRTYTKSTSKSTTKTPHTPQVPKSKVVAAKKVKTKPQAGGEPTVYDSVYELVSKTWFNLHDINRMSQNDQWNMSMIMDEIESVVKEPTTDQLQSFVNWYWKEYPTRSQLCGEKTIATHLRLWLESEKPTLPAVVLSEDFDPFTGVTTLKVRKPDGTTAIVTR